VDKPKTHRVFFALWPDLETRRAISRHAIPSLENVAGRNVDQHQWHITLAFLGNISEEMLTCVQQQAAQVSVQSFELTLDTVGYWSRPKVVWLGSQNMPDVLKTLVTDLNVALKACGYEPEYKDFKAHMTLIRKVTRRPANIQFMPITWQVEQFVLIESSFASTGSDYRILRQWSEVNK